MAAHKQDVDEYGIPKDLGPRALKQLGRFRKPVQQFVRRVNKIRWMQRGGEPETWDVEVLRIQDLEDAQHADDAFIAVSDTVWMGLESIGKAVGRYEIMQAAEDYWIVYFDPHPRDRRGYIDLLSARIESDLVGALREIVLDDVVSIHFFREAVDWYEKGHWCCAIAEDGRRVVW